MQQLHLVGLTTDLDSIICSARKGAKSGSFVLPLDERLLQAIAEAVSRRNADGVEIEVPEALQPPSASAPRRQSHLSPREIQDRLRSGRSLEDIAAEAGVGEEWVARFSAPVEAERSQVVGRARRLTYYRPRRGDSGEPLGMAVRWNLADRGVRLANDEFDAAWSAYQLADSAWMVTFRYEARKREHEAEWEVDLATDELLSRNRLATELGYVEPGRRRRAISSLQPAATTSTTRARLQALATTGAPAASEAANGAPNAAAEGARSAGAGATGRKATSAKKSAAKKATAKKSAAKKSTAGKSAAKSSTAKKAATKKAAKSAATRSLAKSAAKTSPAARKPTAKKPAAKKAAAGASKRPAARGGSGRAAAKAGARRATSSGARGAAKGRTVTKSTARSAKRAAPPSRSTAKKTGARKASARTAAKRPAKKAATRPTRRTGRGVPPGQVPATRAPAVDDRPVPNELGRRRMQLVSGNAPSRPARTGSAGRPAASMAGVRIAASRSGDVAAAQQRARRPDRPGRAPESETETSRARPPEEIVAPEPGLDVGDSEAAAEARRAERRRARAAARGTATSATPATPARASATGDEDGGVVRIRANRASPPRGDAELVLPADRPPLRPAQPAAQPRKRLFNRTGR